MVILDTSKIIDHLRQSKAKKSDSLFGRVAQEVTEAQMAISVVSIQELYTGQSSKNEAEKQRMWEMFSQWELLSYTYEVAELAGELMRDSKKLLEFADAAIAATAILNGAELFTLNKKDFETIKDLELFEFE